MQGCFSVTGILFIIVIVNICFSNSINDQTDQITKNLRCLVCQGQSVYESNSDFAVDIKKLVKKKIKENKSDEEIYSFLKSKYGEVILYTPEINLKNIALWILPLAFILFGGGIIFFRNRYEK